MANGERMTGGCLCGALRYEARPDPDTAYCCYCRDCHFVLGSMRIDPAFEFSRGQRRPIRTPPIVATRLNASFVRNAAPPFIGLVRSGPNR
jgi:hypothetical protein